MLQREIRYPGEYLRGLIPYFRLQAREGRDFSDFDRPFLDDYLRFLKPWARRIFLVALCRWLKFLQGQSIPLSPAEPQLPGGPANCLKRKEKRLSLQPPAGWPQRARQLYEEFASRLRQKLKHPRAHLAALHRFFPAQIGQDLSFRDFPAGFLQRYLAPKTDDACNSIVSALWSWMRFLYIRKELLLPLHEELAQYRRRSRGRRVLLSYPQVLQVLNLPTLDDAEGLRDRAMLEMAYACGLRPGELLALDLTDLDLSIGLVSLRRTKTDHQRNLPLTRPALHYLKLYLEQARPQLTSPLSLNALWLSANGRRADPGVLRKRLSKVYKARQALGFAFTLYQLRHACATHLLQAGASLRHVQELLGHRDLSSTAIYTHITPLYLQAVHQRCHPRNLPGFGPGKEPSDPNEPG
jgi:site-specific recombinase XerD